MKQILLWVLFISFCLLHYVANSAVEPGVRTSLINFLATLNGTTGQPDPSFGWNNATDPCVDRWKGVICDSQSQSFVKKIYLNQSSLSGTFDATALCNLQPLAASLQIIKLDRNNIGGQLPAEIVNCKNLLRLHLGYNRFVGSLPESLARLNSLQRLDFSYNKFSGSVPNLSRISGLEMFLVQYNQLSGEIPNFDLRNFNYFNVSFNDFSGPVPVNLGGFDKSSFLENPGLCGPVLGRNCQFSPNEDNSTSDNDGKKSKATSTDQLLMYSGYSLVGVILIGVIMYKLCKRKKKERKGDPVKVESADDRTEKPSSASTYNNKTGESRSEFSANSAESAMVSTSLVILTSPQVNGLRFDDLLRAPAELISRGKHGSLYKVICENGMILAVKRIKDWAISCNEFKQRMQTIYQVNHPHILPALAFYCSNKEKLLVYEYQQYGSLYKLLHGTQIGLGFDWMIRLNVAATIAEALAFMHQELGRDGIAHGNLKSSNILLNKNMEPCISEYGLMPKENEEDASERSSGSFKEDVHGFGVIVLELLTGKVVQNNGLDLTKWVNSVVREEWTVEVFDKKLILRGASEERMVNLLQVAVNCVNNDPEARPKMNQVAFMINTIKEEEDKSLTFDA